MFDTLVKTLDEQGGSVRAYDACARAARARIVSEPENAAALFLISYAAQRFVDAYDDQPLTAKAAAEEFEQFRALVGKLENGFAGANVEGRVGALNAVAAQLGVPKG